MNAGLSPQYNQEDLLRPTVLLIQDPDHNAYDEPIPVNFSAHPKDLTPLEIIKVLDAEKEEVQIEEVLADWVAL